MPATTTHDACKGRGCDACQQTGEVRHYFEIPAHNFSVLEEKLVKLNRKAVKLGTTPITLEVIGEHEQKQRQQATGVEYVVVVKHVVVHGETPRVAGWDLVAKITAVETEAGVENLVQCVPGQSVPARFRTAVNNCEHCNSKRHRKDTFILRDIKTGDHKQVGRNCLGDFLGGVSPESVLARCQWSLGVLGLASDSEGDGWGERMSERSTPLSQFVATTAICIRKLGWISRGLARDNDAEATADTAWSLCNPPHTTEALKAQEAFVARLDLFVCDSDTALTVKAIEWAKALPVVDVPDYLFNLGVAVRMGYVVSKNMGLVASLVSAYSREVEKVIADKVRAEEAADLTHEGVVGQRRGFEACRVVGTRSWEGHYGVTTLVRFRMDSGKGNHVNWFASGDVTDDWEIDHVYDITGTVKKHDEYKGTKQTVVNRVKLGLPK